MERYYNLSDVNTKGLSKITGKELKKEGFCNYTVKLTTFRKAYFYITTATTALLRGSGLGLYVQSKHSAARFRPLLFGMMYFRVPV